MFSLIQKIKKGFMPT